MNKIRKKISKSHMALADGVAPAKEEEGSIGRSMV
jgi:hypothetical protein